MKEVVKRVCFIKSKGDIKYHRYYILEMIKEGDSYTNLSCYGKFKGATVFYEAPCNENDVLSNFNNKVHQKEKDNSYFEVDIKEILPHMFYLKESLNILVKGGMLCDVDIRKGIL